MMARVGSQPSEFNRFWATWKFWAAAVAVALAMGAMSRLHRYASAALMGQPFEFWTTFAKSLPIFAVLNPVRIAAVWFLADRFRFEHGGWRRHLQVHVLAALLLAYVHVLIESFYYALMWDLQPGLNYFELVETRFFNLLPSVFQLDFLWYWSILGVHYAYYYYQFSQEQVVRAARLETSLTSARLQALRSQLNPHFLFNTLNTISVLALKGEKEAVAEMLAQLSVLLRMALDDRRPDEITLEKELDFVEGYLKIEQIRFADRLSIVREVAPDTLNAFVPAMLLEPIVGNAIKHAVSQSSEACEVSIQARRQGDELRLEVRDTGPGFAATRPLATSKGIGLANTEARLEQFYGPSHRIEYSGGDVGASVVVTIPFSTRRVRETPVSA